MSLPKESPATAVERALGILEAVSRRPGGLSNSEISRKLAIPKSSASYILRALERRGYLHRNHEDGKYRMGLKILDLGHGVAIGLDLREIARPILQDLVRRVNLTAHLAILENGEAVYIERVEAPDFILMNTWVGRRMYIHATSIGKALAAGLSHEEVDAILSGHGLVKRTPKTITQRARFLKELEHVRAQGYAMDDEENSLGVRCIGAPVFNAMGRVEAAVGVSGTVAVVNPHTLPRFVDAVKEAARRISAKLGYTAHSPRH
ncbi:MAG TPA: IclR family transcriptional regulator [Candidatus Acidoferrales bacterium]|nr:IclR family transcriptional regulator [Candidatus Acidoferrales bacterium]